MANSKEMRKGTPLTRAGSKYEELPTLAVRMLNVYGFAEISRDELTNAKFLELGNDPDIGVVDFPSFVRLVPTKHRALINMIFGLTGEEVFVYRKNAFCRRAVWNYLIGLAEERKKSRPSDYDYSTDPRNVLTVLGLYTEYVPCKREPSIQRKEAQPTPVIRREEPQRREEEPQQKPEQPKVATVFRDQPQMKRRFDTNYTQYIPPRRFEHDNA